MRRKVISMLRKLTFTILPLLLAVAVGANSSWAQDERFDDRSDENRYLDRTRIDRYLDVDVWTNHADGEYYAGDNITIGFRASRDAYVAIYAIDTRGNVNMLFPSEPNENNFVKGGESYYIPSAYDNYDLVVSGPEGVENIQILASRERFPIPDWYPQSGLAFDYGDRFEYMDYLNQQYFVRYGGQRFAYDRTSIYVNEWEPTYFRPVYHPYYPSWTVTGNVYLDYGWGHSVYINGVYWGCTPLYIPRIYVGWHTVTLYDRYGHCWESDVHITHYNTVVLDKTVIRTSPTVKSKYKEVRVAGYQNPSAAGYKNFDSRVTSMKAAASGAIAGTPNGKSVTRSKTTAGDAPSFDDKSVASTSKRYVRGTPTTVKTDRGIETVGARDAYEPRNKTAYSGDRTVRKSTTGGTPSYYDDKSSRSKATYDRGGDAGSTTYRGKSGTSSRSSDGYYQKKSGSSATPSYRGKSGSSSSSDRSYRPAPRSTGKSSTTVKQPAPSKSSKSSGSVKSAPQKSESSKSNSSGSKSSGSKSSSSKGKSKK